jgi:hypothetical protein
MPHTDSIDLTEARCHYQVELEQAKQALGHLKEVLAAVQVRLEQASRDPAQLPLAPQSNALNGFLKEYCIRRANIEQALYAMPAAFPIPKGWECQERGISH